MTPSPHRRARLAAHVVRALCAGALVFASVAPATAQFTRESPLALDTLVALDETVDANGNDATGVVADALASIGVGTGWGGGAQFIVRPILQRQANSGDWNAQIWIAALRYERTGPVGLRVDAGVIPSPIGMANLMLRPHLNPTIAQPSSLFTALPPVVLRAPRSTLLGGIYPIGASATVSTLRWDARAAIINTSPLRSRRVFAENNPPQFANLVVGGGVTPIVGLRVGASVAHGGWLKAGESPAVTTDRDATIVAVESELSFGYTRILGEWVRDRLATNAGTQVASGFFLQAQQTLTPRWFAASRVERMTAPAAAPAAALPGVPLLTQRLTGVEGTLGYRVTPELTLRVSHRARRGFGVSGFAHTAAVSVVWWKRWL